MTALVARALFPFALVVGAALLVKGYAHVGDGFAAGAAAGLGAVVQFACFAHERASAAVGARFAPKFVAIGLCLALAVALAPALAGLPPVLHAPAPGGEVTRFGVLELHTALAFDAGVALTVYGALVGTFDLLFPPIREDAP